MIAYERKFAVHEISKIFNNLDKWRHFPNYQLERRADIFFTLYLHGIMEKCLHKKLEDIIIPEFPIKIDGEKKDTNRTWKIDYILISKNKEYVYFVELKTDMASKNPAQEKSMLEKQGKRFSNDLENLTKVIKASRYKKKYFHLLYQLCELGLYENANAVNGFLRENDFKSLKKHTLCPRKKTNKQKMKIQIVYIQPKEDPKSKSVPNFKYIYFDSIVEYLKGENFKSDILAKRFIQSLNEWHDTKAGDAPCKTLNSITLL